MEIARSTIVSNGFAMGGVTPVLVLRKQRSFVFEVRALGCDLSGWRGQFLSGNADKRGNAWTLRASRYTSMKPLMKSTGLYCYEHQPLPNWIQ